MKRKRINQRHCQSERRRERERKEGKKKKNSMMCSQLSRSHGTKIPSSSPSSSSTFPHFGRNFRTFLPTHFNWFSLAWHIHEVIKRHRERGLLQPFSLFIFWVYCNFQLKHTFVMFLSHIRDEFLSNHGKKTFHFFVSFLRKKQ